MKGRIWAHKIMFAYTCRVVSGLCFVLYDELSRAVGQAKRAVNSAITEGHPPLNFLE